LQQLATLILLRFGTDYLTLADEHRVSVIK